MSDSPITSQLIARHLELSSSTPTRRRGDRRAQDRRRELRGLAAYLTTPEVERREMDRRRGARRATHALS